MRYPVAQAFLGVALLMLAAGAVDADDLTVSSILAAQQSGASADDIIAMVNSPANTVDLTAGDIITLRDGGVPENVITVIWAHIPAPTPAPVPLEPDDARLVDFVRLIKSGMSETIIAEQVRKSERAYTLSVNDLLYLKQNGAQEPTIAALMATGAGTDDGPAVAPAELVFDDLVLVTSRFWFWEKDHEGRLLLHGDVFSWVDRDDPKDNFEFQTTGLEKVWFTCDARSPENFCYQINFKIVKGDSYRFRDINRESGSNVAVTRIMEALRTYFPRLTFATPTVDG